LNGIYLHAHFLRDLPGAGAISGFADSRLAGPKNCSYRKEPVKLYPARVKDPLSDPPFRAFPHTSFIR
jgi:hypothetical protein